MTNDNDGFAKGPHPAIVFAVGPRGPLDFSLGQVDMAEEIDQKVIEIVSEQMGVDKTEIRGKHILSMT